MFGLDVAVVRLDGVHDGLGLVHAASKVGTDERVRAFDLVVDGLAEVVQQSGTLRELHVDAELGRHDAGEVADLERVLEHVLAVARAELQAAERADEFGVQPVDTAVEGGLLAGLVDLLADELLGLVEHLLDASRMDAAVGDERLQRDAADLAAHRIEAREDDRLGRVVDDEVDAGHLLEGADVAAFSADDAALHVVARDVDDRDGRLGGVVGGDALDRDADDVAGALVGLFASTSLGLADDRGCVAA